MVYILIGWYCQDPSLKRCFGVDRKIKDCDWEYISTLRTLNEPHERMPLLSDVLELLAQEGNERVWMLLDIKVGFGYDRNLSRNRPIHSVLQPYNTVFTQGEQTANNHTRSPTTP